MRLCAGLGVSNSPHIITITSTTVGVAAWQHWGEVQRRLIAGAPMKEKKKTNPHADADARRCGWTM